MQQTMRWFGPKDTVSLRDLKQSGCTGVVTALHQFAPGEVWTVEAIQERKQMIRGAAMEWTVVESLPVHEDIKKQKGNYKTYIENYKQSLVNLGACGLKVITYNFMPVLDWVRTDTEYELPDGSRALYFDRLNFIVFDLFLLNRPGAIAGYKEAEVLAARARFEQMSVSQKEKLFGNCMLGLPGSTEAFTREQVMQALQEYDGIDAAQLREHLYCFLRAIVPVAEAAGLVMAIHPDDPPYPVLGLPRIMSTEADVAALLEAVPLAANGLCFCTGSFGARADNDLLQMADRFASRIHFLHLRNTSKDAGGNFYEADHLTGDADMYAIVKRVVQMMQERRLSIPMRPDHGHQMLDDLDKNTYPGYSAIGRLKGLAELRGLEMGISRQLADNN